MDDHLDLLLKDIRRSSDSAKAVDDCSSRETAANFEMGDRQNEPCDTQQPVVRGRRRGMETVWNKLDF